VTNAAVRLRLRDSEAILATKKTGADGGGVRAKKDGAAGGSAAKGRPAPRKAPARPRLRSSYATAPAAEKKTTREKPSGAPPAKRRVAKADGPAPRARTTGAGPTSRRAPLAGPKRAGKKPASVDPALEASSGAREMALAIAGIGIEKKALGIEILDVAAKVDYCELLVIMTGRSDRHVHAIATGLEEGMRLRKSPAVSVEGLTAATWVLIDFGDVVVHVFQEDTRRLYDIEGLWIDASRIPVPDAEGPAAD
jgi:ribosome-associated protein